MAMNALQEYDRKWLHSELLIAMVDHFKLDIQSTDTYMALQTQLLHRTWVKKQLKMMNYVVDHLIVEDNDDDEAAA